MKVLEYQRCKTELGTEKSTSIKKQDIAEVTSGITDLLPPNNGFSISFTVELENSSSAIGISDVVLQLRHIVGLTELASSQFIAGDIDGDSQISISDVVSNLRVIVGLAESPKGQLVYQDEQRNYDLQHGSVYDFELLIPGDVDGSMSEII